MADGPGHNFLVKPQQVWFDDHSCVMNNKSTIHTALGLPLPSGLGKLEKKKNPDDGKQHNYKPGVILSR